MASAPTPEEKLFAVIQGAKHKPLRRPPSSLSPSALTARLRSAAAALDVPKINQALLVLMVPLGALCALGPLIMRPSPQRVLAKARAQRVPFIIPPPLEGLRAAEELVQLVRANDPFGLGERAVASAPAPVQPMLARQRLADLRLVGIARGAVPTAMVEQVSQNTTHVVKIGDLIGGLTVKAILDDRVVLDAGGEEVELF